MKSIYFERAIFLSWYCAKGDCKFCYMSTQKPLIKNPKMARRKIEGILKEVEICKKNNWKIEFLSGGYESFEFNELVDLVKAVTEIYGEKMWINIGVLSKDELIQLKPYIEGVCGAVECVNPKVRKEVCPSKPTEEIEEMFKICDELNLKKSLTIILGIGESSEDIPLLMEFIKRNQVDQITFYRLKPQKDTAFENAEPIAKEYYAGWVKKTRKEFPNLKIIVGSWLTHLDEISLLLESGADAITKFPAIRLFDSDYAKQIVKEVEKAGMKFESKLTE